MGKIQQKRTEIIYASVKHRLSALLVMLIGIGGILFIPMIVKGYKIKFTFPDVVPFQRLEAYIVAGVPVSFILIILGVYVFITGAVELTGHKHFTKIKTFSVWSCRITLFNLLIAFMFNWHFTTVLDVHGYGWLLLEIRPEQ